MNKVLGLILVLVLVGCASDQGDSETMFTLMPFDETGVDFRNNLVEDIYTENNVLSFEYYYNGAGVAIGDINNDGLQDLFFTGNTVENRLFLNKGNFKFQDITRDAGILVPKTNFSTGVSMSDVNQDGFLDIYVCQGGPNPDPVKRENLLFINQGDLTFKEEAEQYGLNDGNRSTQAAFFDFDKDNDLDCFIMNYSKYFRIELLDVLRDIENKDRLIEASSRMMRNDGGRFTDITEEAGMLKYGYGLGLVISDINEDGLLDVYQTNDYSVPDFMYINQGDGTFKDEIKERTMQLSWFAMGADIADINNDGLLDIGVVDMAATDHVRDKTLMAPMDTHLFWYAVNTLSYQYQYMFNTVQLNSGNGQFKNVANLLGLARTEWSWAALFADFDNDGHKDYFISNGYRRYARDNDFRNALRAAREENGGMVPNALRQKYYDLMPQVKLPNMLARNDGHLHFADIASDWGLGEPCYSNGAAYGDLDNDGDLDLVISNIDDIAHLYRNNAVSVNDNHYIRIDLESPHSVIGTRVRALAGERIFLVEYSPVRGFQSSVDPILHLGLGDLETVNLDVQWPDGKRQMLNGVSTNKTITLNYKDASHASNAIAKPDPLLLAQDARSLGVTYQHVENVYDDFKKEILLPYKQSTLGPLLSVGDVNGDQREDVFVGGATGQSGVLFIQRENGGFDESPSAPWTAHRASEDLGSLLFDADGDRDLDLYVVSGGNEFAPDASELQDRLYFNNGKGAFEFRQTALPVMRSSGMRVAAADFDGDQDLDLYVGGRHKPGHYPDSDKSYLLRNDRGRFTDVTDDVAPELRNPGMVNDVVWADLNADKRPDLLLAIEWGPVKCFNNTGNGFTEITNNLNLGEHKGWWMNIEAADIDADGDLDIVAGNLGLNSKFYASQEKPFLVFGNDFDSTGTWDLVLSKTYKDHLVPVRGRQCSSEQMPFIKEKFSTFNAFATASLEDIYGEEKLENSLRLETTEFRSMIFINDNGVFTPEALPIEAQSSPLYGIVVADVNGDSHADIVTCGNLFDNEIETPRMDAGTGRILIGDGAGGFKPVSIQSSGFYAPGNVKDAAIIESTGVRYLIIAQNNGPIQVFAIPSGKREI